MTDQPSREGERLRQILEEFAVSHGAPASRDEIERAAEAVEKQVLRVTLQAAEAERDRFDDEAERIGVLKEEYRARAEAAEARERALREAADELREAAWTYRHHVNPPTVRRAFDEAGREYDRVTNRSTRSLSTQEPTR